MLNKCKAVKYHHNLSTCLTNRPRKKDRNFKECTEKKNKNQNLK